MPGLDHTSWKLLVAFAAVAGFMVSIMVYRTNDMADRLRKVEIEQAKLWCSMNPETCQAGQRRK